MPKSSKISKDFPIECLVGGETAAQSVVLRGMRDLESELAARFKERAAASAALTKATRPQTAAMEALLRERDPEGQMVKDLQALDRSYSKTRLPSIDVMPERARIFSGSIGATRVPPYNYQWTWNATNGGPAVSVGASANTGAMNYNLWTNSRRSSASAAAAVGIYFRPAFETGILRIWANPALSYNWWTSCAFASAHSDGWIGLNVGRYTLAGGSAGTPVRQQTRLWNDDSWWSGASDSGSNSGYPLFAQLSVDRSHWYALWVWIGGSISGAGWGTFSGSGAGAVMNARVPAITWELF